MIKQIFAGFLVLLLLLSIPATAYAAGSKLGSMNVAQSQNAVMSQVSSTSTKNYFENRFMQGLMKGIAKHNFYEARTQEIKNKKQNNQMLVLDALSSLTSLSTTNILSLMNTYKVNWEKIVLAYSIIQATPTNDTIESVLKAMPKWQDYIKKQNVSTSSVMKKFQTNISVIRSKVVETKKQNLMLIKNEILNGVATVLSTSTSQISQLMETYDVGIDRILIAYAISTSTTGKTAIDVLTMINQTGIKSTITNLNINKDTVLSKVESYVNSITSYLQSKSIPIPPSITDLVTRLQKLLD